MLFHQPILQVKTPVAIIGSSASILKRGLGPKIDTFPTVIRFNRQVTEGYEADVGSRTDLRMVNAHVFMSRPFTRWTVDQNFVRRLRDCRVALQDMQPGLELEREKYIDPSVELHVFQIRHLRQKTHQIIPVPIGLPSMGMAAILTCIASGIVPTVYGWDLDQDAPMSHYWEERDQQAPHHRIESERFALRQLRKQGKIVVP